MVHKWTAVWMWSAEKTFCASLDSVHACHFPQPGAHPRNLNMNDQSTAHIHNRETRTGLIKHHVGLSTPIHGSHRPRYTIPKRGKRRRSSPHETCAGLFGLMELTALAYRENGPRPISVQRRAVAGSIWSNPPAPSHEWRNPRRAAIPPLSGVEPALLVPSA